MSALSEFSLEMVFIREAEVTELPEFQAVIERELSRLFKPYAQWSASGRTEGGLELVTAEMKGIGPWESEDEVLTYMDSKTDESFWNWLQGYRLQVEPKEDAGCCKCKH